MWNILEKQKEEEMCLWLFLAKKCKRLNLNPGGSAFKLRC
jgi:hypothetical protein